jgi:hypothetical protein
VVLAGTGWLSACSQGKTSDQRRLPFESVDGSYIVEMKLTDDTTPEQSREQLQKIAGSLAETVNCTTGEPEDIAWESGNMGVLATSLSHTYHVQFEDCQMTDQQSDEVLAGFYDHEAIQSAEANAVIRASLQENDPYKSRQYYLEAINREAACDQAGALKDKPIVVAVIDSGVDKDHPDLVERLYRDDRGRVIGANFVGKGSRRSPDSDWDDDNGHGTHVAGLVAAVSDNGQGIAGVGSCANVVIMPVRVMGPNGRGNSLEIDRGIQWAAANGADIINLSLGSNSLTRTRSSSHSKSLYNSLAKRGIIVFAAAGNDGLVNGSRYNQGWRSGYVYSYPASYDNVIAVASTREGNALSSFSNRGDRIDIAAPGSQTLSTYPRGGYKYLSGTSMASPVAAGAYALALAAVQSTGQERLAHDDLADIMLKKAVNRRVSFSSSDVAAGGLVDAKSLLSELRQRFPGGDSDEGDAPEKPTNPVDPGDDQTPDNPGTEPGDEQGFRFVGLEGGQRLDGPVRIKLTDWPEGTVRIKLYWITPQDWFPRPFTSVDRDNLAGDGEQVVTFSRYNLYGDKYLAAEAVDSRDRRLGVISLQLQGL